MTRPNIYELGSSPELILAFFDQDDNPFIPIEARISIEEPDGTIITISGGDMTVIGSGTLMFLYNPPITGWYTWESWGRDNGSPPKQIAGSSGFEVVDSVVEG